MHALAIRLLQQRLSELQMLRKTQDAREGKPPSASKRQRRKRLRRNGQRTHKANSPTRDTHTAKAKETQPKNTKAKNTQSKPIKPPIHTHPGYKRAPFIDPLRGRFAGQDVWVIASGPSASFVEPSFFDGKVTVGINQVYKRFPNLMFYVRKEGPGMLEAIRSVPRAMHIVSTGCKGSVNNRNLTTYLDLKPKPRNVRFFKHNQCAKALERKHLEALPPGHLISSYSTITSGIHFAAFLGARSIMVLGHDCGTLDGSSNIPSYYQGTKPAQRTRGRYVSWLGKIGSHTVTLKNWLRDTYGCDVYSLNPFVNLDLEGHKYKAS